MRYICELMMMWKGRSDYMAATRTPGAEFATWVRLNAAKEHQERKWSRTRSRMDGGDRHIRGGEGGRYRDGERRGRRGGKHNGKLTKDPHQRIFTPAGRTPPGDERGGGLYPIIAHHHYTTPPQEPSVLHHYTMASSTTPQQPPLLHHSTIIFNNHLSPPVPHPTTIFNNLTPNHIHYTTTTPLQTQSNCQPLILQVSTTPADYTTTNYTTTPLPRPSPN